MSVLDCIAGKVAAGELTPQQGESARRVHEGILGDLYMRLPAATATAHAALETARIIEEGAVARRYALAKDAISYAKGLERVEQHPDGAIAGFMGILSRDIRGEGGINVESVAKDYEGRMAEALHAVDPYRSTTLGLRQDRTGIRDMVREVFGVATRSNAAKEAAAAWRRLDEFATQKARELGKVFSPAEDWRLPQWWETSRVIKFGRGEFVGDLEAAIERGGLQVFDPDTGLPANALRQRIIIDAAADKILVDSSAGAGGGAFRSDMRTFRFTEGSAGADAYLSLMDKYGAGRGGYLSMMEGHVSSVARELGMLHVLGPGYRANGEALLERAKELNARTLAEGPKPSILQRIGRAAISGLESPVAAERLLKYQTGQLSGAESELMAGIVGGARSFLSSTSLGSAIVTAIPGDSVNALMAARHVGIDEGRLLKRIMETFLADNPNAREEASRLGIVAHASMDAALGTKRFADQIVGEKLMGRLADFVIRAQGLHAWDSAVKRAFTMEFLGTIAQRGGKAWGDLDEPFREFLEHYRFTPDEWATLAKAEHHLPVGEARFLMPDTITDEALRVKLMSAIYDERQFAYLGDASARVKALATGGAKAGTLAGEATRSMFLFKSFAMTMIATWGMRAATQGNTADKLFLAAQLGFFLTMAGAVSVQARQILDGKDPRAMTDPWFWGEAAFTGGAMGVYGDFLNQAFSRSGSSLTESLLGPLASIPSSIQRMTSGARRAAEEGAHVNFGGALAEDLRRFTPGGNWWYGRLLAKRYIFDTIRQRLDPDYRKAFARQRDQSRKLSGQEFYWAPGEAAPSRAPDLGAMLGRR